MSLLSPLSNTALHRIEKIKTRERLDSLSKDSIEILSGDNHLLPRAGDRRSINPKIANEETRAILYWNDYKRQTQFCKVYLRRRQFIKLWLLKSGYTVNDIAAFMKIDPKDLNYQLKKCHEVLITDQWTENFFGNRCKAPTISIRG